MTTVMNDMVSAYGDVASRIPPYQTDLGAGKLGAETSLITGVYTWTASLEITGDITLQRSASDTWIFQIAGNLLVDVGTHMTLSGGATYNNVFWQVAGHTELFAGS